MNVLIDTGRAIIDLIKHAGWWAAIPFAISAVVVFLVNDVVHEPVGCEDGQVTNQYGTSCAQQILDGEALTVNCAIVLAITAVIAIPIGLLRQDD
jgi:hypothetical protein